MSRAKRSAAKERKAAAREPAARAAPAAPPPRDSRFAPALRRGRHAKLAIGAVAAVGFGSWMLLARLTYAGHPKHPVKELAIPQPLYQVVRRNLLQAGILAPATAPPDATTSTS
jgi:hypothetical protein